MRKEDNKQSWRQRLVIWVDGEREPKDRSLFVMERHPHRFSRPTDQEFETREKRRLQRREIEELRLRQRAQARMEILDAISDALESARARAEGSGEALERRKAELSEALERVRQRRDREQHRSIRSYRGSLRLLRSNPTAHARGLDEALDALRSLSDKVQK